MKKYVVLLFVLFLVSCNNSKKQSVFNLLKEWNSREIQFPNHLVFTIQGRDTVDFRIEDKYKIITYVDSIGCTSCNLKFAGCEEFYACCRFFAPRFSAVPFCFLSEEGN